MATLTSILQLSTSGVAKDGVNITYSNIANVKNPAIQTSTATVATGSDTDIVTPAASNAAYVYVCNKDATNFVKVKLGGNELLRVGPGEANLFCVHSNNACALRADTAECKVEFGYWTFDKY